MKPFLSTTAVISLLLSPTLSVYSINHDNSTPRRLPRRQQETAQSVGKAVEAATSSGVHGLALPLNYVILSNRQGYEQQLAVTLSVEGEEQVANLLIDTGSSSLAFCDSAFAADRAERALETDYAQCNLYSTPVECPDGKEGYNVGWVGPVYKGDVRVHDPMDNAAVVASLTDVFYAIIDEQRLFYACDGPLDGIMGVAYTGLNRGYEIPSTFDFADMGTELCEENGRGVFSCNTKGLEETKLDAPLEQTLAQIFKEGEDHKDAFGLYCDYAATADVEFDSAVPNLGAIFVGDLAMDNQYYNGGTPHIAKITTVGTSNYFYSVNLQKIRLPSMNMTFGMEDYCDPKLNNCFTDSGTSGIYLPISQSNCDSIRSASNEELGGSLLIDLEGPDGGEDITLSFPLDWIVEQAAAGRITFTDPASRKGNFVLGFPIFQHYYVAYNMGEGTLAFVDIPQQEDDRSLQANSNSTSKERFESWVCSSDEASTSAAASNSFVLPLISVGLVLITITSS